MFGYYIDSQDLIHMFGYYIDSQEIIKVQYSILLSNGWDKDDEKREKKEEKWMYIW